MIIFIFYFFKSRPTNHSKHDQYFKQLPIICTVLWEAKGQIQPIQKMKITKNIRRYQAGIQEAHAFVGWVMPDQVIKWASANAFLIQFGYVQIYIDLKVRSQAKFHKTYDQISEVHHVLTPKWSMGIPLFSPSVQAKRGKNEVERA